MLYRLLCCLRPSARFSRRMRRGGVVSAQTLERRCLLTTFFPSAAAADGSADSLRAAIIEANSNGQSDVIVLEEGNYRLTIDNSASHEDAAREGDLDLTEGFGLTIRGQGVGETTITQTVTDRVFQIFAGASVTFEDLTITGGQAADNSPNGGGVHNAGSTTVRRSTVTDNSAEDSGGGVWNAGSLHVEDGSRISRNEAHGDEADAGGGGIYHKRGRLTLDGATDRVSISNNLATGQAGSGGGLFGRAGSMSLRDVDVEFNSANRAGGGIEVVRGRLELVDSNLITNDVNGLASGDPAPGNGGGLHVTGPARVKVQGGSVFGNEAAREGGGLWNQAGARMRVTGTDIAGNLALGDAADDGGGGIFNNGGTLIVRGGSIDENFADGAAGSGGGIFNADGGVVIVTNTSVSGNIANRAGGGIEDASGRPGLLYLRSVHLNDNNAGVAPDALAASPGNGGGLHVTGEGTIIVQGGTVNRNLAASEGGGLWNGTGTMTVYGGTQIEENAAFGDAADNGGGGIFNNGGRVFINGAAIVDNDAIGEAGSGGGIFSTDGRVVLRNSTVNGNRANRAGGGIEIVTGLFSSTRSTIAGNAAGFDENASPGNGGGVHVTGAEASVRIQHTEVVNNRAAKEGGGLWNQIDSLMVVIASDVASNSAMSAQGGGIFDNGGRLLVTRSDISFNEAGTDGGGVAQVSGAKAKIVRAKITGNESGGDGGGIYNDGELRLLHSRVSHNFAAERGGGLFNDENGSVFERRNRFFSNRSGQ